jgi:hypothetical protein
VSGAEVDVIVDPAVREDKGGVGIRRGQVGDCCC